MLPSGDDAPPSAQLQQPLSIAILLNSYRSKLLPAIQASYVRAIGAVAPDAKLVFFEPANKGILPDPELFDLIVLGGANVDARKTHPWIRKVHEFVRHVVVSYPEKKILGICWGHQTISIVFGGEVVDMDVPEMGVTCVNLTDKGRSFFRHTSSSTGMVRIQQHHRREVARAPEPFVQLAQGNQVLMHENGNILTLQGHPEKDAQTARLRMHDTTRWFGFDSVDEKAWSKLETQIGMEHDGAFLWSRILDWVREPGHAPASPRAGRWLKM
ncbi:class I glutamine amidotransferase-like protein [Pseudomassariella vexata]|uniref:Class I glutamine amidotransferase-like protein n=1 Tax=Pseudomassariella vexata TaxID=1141098 RepID=A0A1Y2DVU7_9PEZI|nr:class I glutamine amidotransferase-like protein [Pseudomassariella vexata]ORY63401.1 class I glutamine amidotransferase-like protein [Pseudomassariella vexata]